MSSPLRGPGDDCSLLASLLPVFHWGAAFCPYAQVHFQTVVIIQSFPSSISPHFFFHAQAILRLLPYYIFLLIPFFLWKLAFLKFLALLLPLGQIFVLPWAAAARLAHSRGDRTVVSIGEQFPICAALDPAPDLRTAQLSLCFSHHPYRGFQLFPNLVAVTVIPPKLRCTTI